MGQLFLIATFSFCGSYFLFKRRSVDFLTLYFSSLVLFSLPLFFSSAYLVGARRYVYPEIETYASYGLAFLGCVFIALFSDGVKNKARFSSEVVKITSDNRVYFYYCFFSLFFSLAVLSLIFSGIGEARNKSQALDNVGVEYMVMGSLLVSGYLVSLLSEQKAFSVIFLLLAVGVFLIGSRSPLVFIILGRFFSVSKSTQVVLVKKAGWLLVAVSGLVFVVLGKSLYGYMYSGLGFSAWFSDFNSDYFVVGSEFLRTNGILNSVVVSNYQIPWWSVFVSFLKILPFPEGFYSVDISYFSNNFQNDVFPWVDYGIAFNPLAEAYAWAGLWGVAFYALFIPMMLSTLWRLYLNSGGPLFKAILILAGVTVAFWVHRNTLGSTFGYIRNAVYPSLVIYFLAFSCATILRGGR